MICLGLDKDGSNNEILISFINGTLMMLTNILSNNASISYFKGYCGILLMKRIIYMNHDNRRLN